ncbi:disulfide oxidoreductase [Cannes 8 virus]|uniref:Sulfhydryl oxidase n=2 Tax=Marseillevirus TaxID=1513458 RepID=D2XAV5_GBMV|nr:disulfide oxidoreductase [Marseillevirus marseillevirus]YP_009094779.1 conserved disulfide oxidoreductase [Melbournevirus]AGV01673.1 disulfide oxidoreductase [Cannes 8 virus]AVR53025.1 disulfide oxidoreductase [Marseillevirus Shanghai 1]ADB04082.1 disulfide oxidoreductase [Marseillevirus marseillevirus]AIT54891.1 disulfide oxidoreductase [Melbournevirus]
MRQVKRQVRQEPQAPRTTGENKEFWGPCLWRTIHSFAATYTPQQSQAFMNFISGLQSLIPCVSCRANFKKNLAELPPLRGYLDSREKAFYWTYLLHDKVNKELGKKSPPFQKVREVYFERLLGKGSCSSCRG